MATTEERLAALEAKLAQLTDTRPTTYYTHQYSGEEMDAAVGRALTGGALDTSVTNVSNQLGTLVRPNLLDNWYFGRPVNQRGQTEYTGDVYGVDRWKSLSDKIQMTIVDGGLTVSTTSQKATEIIQPFERPIPAGTRLTISALISKPENSSGNGVVRIKYADGSVGIQTTIPYRAMDHEVVSLSGDAKFDVTGAIIRPANNGPITIHAVKLELGPTQTLAHQENGVWVLNEVPEYGGQLRRCQRYFRRIAPAQYAGFARGYAYNASSVRVMIPFETMRTSPTLNLNNATGIFASNSSAGDIFGLSFSGVWTTPESVTFDVAKTGAFVDAKEYILRGDNNGYIDIIADL